MINPLYFGQVTKQSQPTTDRHPVHLQLILFSFSVFGCLHKVNKVLAKSGQKSSKRKNPLQLALEKFLAVIDLL